MEEINYKKLRKDLIDYFESAYFVGGYGAALVDVSKIENASEEELIKIAKDNKFNLNKYIIIDRDCR